MRGAWMRSRNGKSARDVLLAEVQEHSLLAPFRLRMQLLTTTTGPEASHHQHFSVMLLGTTRLSSLVLAPKMSFRLVCTASSLVMHPRYPTLHQRRRDSNGTYKTTTPFQSIPDQRNREISPLSWIVVDLVCSCVRVYHVKSLVRFGDSRRSCAPCLSSSSSFQKQNSANAWLILDNSTTSSPSSSTNWSGAPTKLT